MIQVCMYVVTYCVLRIAFELATVYIFLCSSLGFTPLMKSCVVGDVGCLHMLIGFGASITCRVNLNVHQLASNFELI